MAALLQYTLFPVLFAVIKLVCLLIAIAYYTLAERKIMASFQRRVGPNVVGPLGLLQPLADGLKLAGKELVTPSHANSRIFIVVAMSVLAFALLAWSVIPFNLFDYSERMSSHLICRMLDHLDYAPFFIPKTFLPESIFWESGLALERLIPIPPELGGPATEVCMSCSFSFLPLISLNFHSQAGINTIRQLV